MRRRFWIRIRHSGSRYLVQLHGELDGSTACQALGALAQAPGQAQELVVDLAGVTMLDRFGLEVLTRGAPSCSRGRMVRMIGVLESESSVEGGGVLAPARRPA